MLEIGNSAPDFSLLDQDEVKHHKDDYIGGWWLVYFYPKDDTPGCTKEACTIAEVYEEFSKLNVKVVGVSKDSTRSHKKFAEKYNLPFTLLSDSEGKMIEAYGAFKEKSMYGKTFMGIDRVSYLIDPKGLVARTYPKVDPATHAHILLEDIKSLQSNND